MKNIEPPDPTPDKAYSVSIILTGVMVLIFLILCIVLPLVYKDASEISAYAFVMIMMCATFVMTLVIAFTRWKHLNKINASVKYNWENNGSFKEYYEGITFDQKSISNKQTTFSLKDLEYRKWFEIITILTVGLIIILQLDFIYFTRVTISNNRCNTSNPNVCCNTNVKCPVGFTETETSYKYSLEEATLELKPLLSGIDVNNETLTINRGGTGDSLINVDLIYNYPSKAPNTIVSQGTSWGYSFQNNGGVSCYFGKPSNDTTLLPAAWGGSVINTLAHCLGTCHKNGMSIINPNNYYQPYYLGTTGPNILYVGNPNHNSINLYIEENPENSLLNLNEGMSIRINNNRSTVFNPSNLNFTVPSKNNVHINSWDLLEETSAGYRSRTTSSKISRCTEPSAIYPDCNRVEKIVNLATDNTSSSVYYQMKGETGPNSIYPACNNVKSQSNLGETLNTNYRQMTPAIKYLASSPGSNAPNSLSNIQFRIPAAGENCVVSSADSTGKNCNLNQLSDLQQILKNGNINSLKSKFANFSETNFCYYNPTKPIPKEPALDSNQYPNQVTGNYTTKTVPGPGKPAPLHDLEFPNASFVDKSATGPNQRVTLGFQ